MKKRVAIFTHALGWGGSETGTLGVADALVAQGHDVVLVQCGHDLYDRYAPLAKGHRRMQMTLPAAFERVSLQWWMGALRRLGDPDICVLAKGWFELRSTALDLALRIRGHHYVLLEYHPAEVPPPRSSKRHFGGLVPGLGLWYWRFHLPRRFHLGAAHRVIVASDHVAHILQRHYGLVQEKTHRVHPGIDLSEFRARPDARAAFRSQWKIPQAATVFGSVGRLARVKRLDRLLSTFATLRSARPELEAWMVLAGEGPLLDELRQRAIQLGIAERVVFPAYVHSAADALSSLDVYLLASEAEGFGLALVEAMACGCVPVAMNSGGPGEILTDRAMGWLSPADDQARFDDAVLEAASLSESARAGVRRHARRHIEANFERGRQSGRIAELIVTA